MIMITVMKIMLKIKMIKNSKKTKTNLFSAKIVNVFWLLAISAGMVGHGCFTGL